MTIRTYCGGLRAILDRATVRTVLIGDKDLRTASVVFHQQLLTVAIAAGCGNVGVIDRRLWITRWQNCVRIAMATNAGRGCRSVLLRCSVEAVLIRGLCVGVTLRAFDFRGGRLVWRRLYILVAVDAGEHAAMDGLLHLVRVDGEADCFSIRVC